MIYDAICWTASSTMNLKTTVLQDLQQPLYHVSKNTLKKILLPPENYQVAHWDLRQHCKDVTEPSNDFCCHFWYPHLFVFSRNNKKEPAWTPLSYWPLILQHLHKFSPIPVTDRHEQSLSAYILLCIPWLLRTQKATNKITVTVSPVGRTPLSVFPQETVCCPASKSNGIVILHSSNFIVSVASPLIKSFNYFR